MIIEEFLTGEEVSVRFSLHNMIGDIFSHLDCLFSVIKGIFVVLSTMLAEVSVISGNLLVAIYASF